MFFMCRKYVYDFIKFSVLRDYFQYLCVNCNNSTIYCLKCNKNLETLLHCAFFRCFTCKRLTRTTKIETITANNNEILQHLFRNNTQDQQTFRHYFNFGEQNNVVPFNMNISTPISRKFNLILKSR